MSEDDWPLPIIDRDAWAVTAACRGKSDVMFAVRSADARPISALSYSLRAQEDSIEASARALCAECPHAGLDGPCVAEWKTLVGDIADHGVWGGFTPVELRRKFPELRRRIATTPDTDTDIEEAAKRKSAKQRRKLKGPTAVIMQILLETPGLTATEIRKLGDLSMHTSSRLADLEKAGYVQKRQPKGLSAKHAKWWPAGPKKCWRCGEWTIGLCHNAPRKSKPQSKEAQQ